MKALLAALALAGALLLGFDAVLIRQALGRDLGQWGGGQDQAIREWYAGLMQPDNPTSSCCGTSDAYWADEFEIEGDHYVAIVTDTREDAPLLRPHVEPGTRVPIPNTKMKWDAGNPTGHGVLFLQAGTRNVYCYVAPGGV